MKRQLHNFLSLLSGIFFFFFSSKFYAQGVNSPNNFSFSQHDTVPCKVKWKTPQQISFDSIHVGWPQILERDSTIVLIWQRGSFRGIGVGYSRSTNFGNSWSNPQLLIPDTHNDNTSVVFSATDGQWIYVVWNGCEPCNPEPNPRQHIRFIRSSNFGASWLPTQIISFGIGSAFKVVAYQNKVFINFRDTTASKIIISEDNGESFSIIYNAPSFLGNYAFKAFAVSFSGLHGMITLTDTNWTDEVYYFHSSDFGLSWDTPQMLSTLDNYNANVWNMGVDGNNVYAIWNDGKYGGFFTGTLLLRRSTDGGNTFGPEQILSSNKAVGYNVDVRDNIIAVVWETDEGTIDDIYHTYFSISRDFGSSFCSPARVETSFLKSEQPDIVIGKNFFVAASWRDSGNPTAKIFFTKTESPTRVFEDNNIPRQSFVVFDPFPNPFNPIVTVKYNIFSPVELVIEIFDILGRKVYTTNQQIEYGTYFFEWNGKNNEGMTLASGLYFVKFSSDKTNIIIKKIIYIN
jgi:hypothetical protein